MDYTIKFCPKCGGELHIPQNLQSCICMYCGETIEVHENSSKQKSETQQKIEEEYKEAFISISRLLEAHELYLNQFTKNNYKSSFEKYAQTGRSILLPIEKYAFLFEDKREEIIQETAKALIATINKALGESSKGLKISQKETRIYQYRFFLTVYTIPMLLDLHLAISEPMVDCILAEWSSQYPKDTFQKANYAELAAGFERKGLCFITSASCDALGKRDDCYELTTFRDFRDTYMMQTEERKNLVEEYYRIAPAIVMFINTLQESRKEYDKLWQEYLLPCLKDIENNRLEDCEIKYTQMLKNLRVKYCLG